MRTMSRGGLHRRAFRLGLLSVAAVLVSACSSDSDRLSFFGVDQAQPTTVAAVQPQYAQPQYVQPQYTQPQVSQTQFGTPQTITPGPQPLNQPAPYIAPTYTAPGYPQTTASIGQPVRQAQPTVQALPQPVTAQPVMQQQVVQQPVMQQQTFATAQRAPLYPPNNHLAQTPTGMVGQNIPVTRQVPNGPVQQPTFQAQPLTTASIGAPQTISPQPVTTGSIAPVRSAPQTLPTPQMMPAQLATRPSGQTPGVDRATTGSIGAAQPRVPVPIPRPVALTRTATVQPQRPAQTTAVSQVAPQTVASAGTHRVAPGETLYSIARRYNMRPQDLIAANAISDPNAIRIGQRLAVSSSGQPVQPVAQLPAATRTPAQVVASRSYTPPRPAETAARVQQTAAIQQVAVRSDQIAEQTPLQFRWPIRGRVLSTFGDQPNGVRNDGVNIAVPEGASIRASEEGEVVYAGNELRGFGNLVLVQHRGGYVTAYAHNSRLDVQRGDRVNRGDVIARAGSTGDVDTPQLHFEIRRGTTPVDPGPYLPTS